MNHKELKDIACLLGYELIDEFDELDAGYIIVKDADGEVIVLNENGAIHIDEAWDKLYDKVNKYDRALLFFNSLVPM